MGSEMNDWISFDREKPDIHRLVEIRFWRYGKLNEAIGFWTGKVAYICSGRRPVASPLHWRLLYKETT